MNKQTTITLKLDVLQKEKIQEIAKRKGLGTSAYIRQACMVADKHISNIY